MMCKDEALSFQIMKEIIKKHDMSVLFNTETPMLKLSFYMLDRLISIQLPDLHSHFKVSLRARALILMSQEENVNSSFFSTSFFITLFTQVLQS